MKKVLWLISIFSIGSSCYKDNREDLYQNLNTDNCVTDVVSFSAQIAPILNRSCALSGCHNAQSATAGVVLSNYSGAAQIASNGKLLQRISLANGEPALMPPMGKLPACDIALIEKWVVDGFPNN